MKEKQFSAVRFLIFILAFFMLAGLLPARAETYDAGTMRLLRYEGDVEILDKDGQVERKADLRAFVLSSEEPVVWKSGLTRFSRNPDSFIVNSSQGGGFKDTWVLSQ